MKYPFVLNDTGFLQGEIGFGGVELRWRDGLENNFFGVGPRSIDSIWLNKIYKILHFIL